MLKAVLVMKSEHDFRSEIIRRFFLAVLCPFVSKWTQLPVFTSELLQNAVLRELREALASNEKCKVLLFIEASFDLLMEGRFSHNDLVGHVKGELTKEEQKRVLLAVLLPGPDCPYQKVEWESVALYDFDPKRLLFDIMIHCPGSFRLVD